MQSCSSPYKIPELSVLCGDLIMLYGSPWICRLVVAAGLLTTIAPLAAFAAPPPAVFKDSAGNVIMHTGVTANESIPVEYTDTPLKRMVRAGYCGEIRIAPNTAMPTLPSSVKVAGTSITLSSITMPTSVPKCVGNAFEPAATGDFKNDAGAYFITGKTPGLSYEVEFIGVPTTKNVRANACGYLRLSNTATNPLPATLKIDGTSQTVSGLPTADPPLCTNGIKYVPQSWLN